MNKPEIRRPQTEWDDDPLIKVMTDRIYVRTDLDSQDSANLAMDLIEIIERLERDWA